MYIFFLSSSLSFFPVLDAYNLPCLSLQYLLIYVLFRPSSRSLSLSLSVLYSSFDDLSLDSPSSSPSPPSPSLVPSSAISRTPPESWIKIIRFATNISRSYADYRSALEGAEAQIWVKEERRKLGGDQKRLWKTSSNPDKLTLATLLPLFPNLKSVSGGTQAQEDLRSFLLLLALFLLHPQTPILVLLEIEVSGHNYQLFTQAMVRLSSSLQSLTLSATNFIPPSSLAIETIEPTSFPLLHSLVVQLNGCPRIFPILGNPSSSSSSHSSPLLFDLLSHWSFPSLRSVGFWMCCSGRDVSPEQFFLRNGKRIEELTWDHHTANPIFLEYAHLIPELKTLVCHPFHVVTKSASELRNLGKVETLMVNDYSPVEVVHANLDQGFFVNVGRETMPALKKVVFLPSKSVGRLWRKMSTWVERLQTDGIEYLKVE